MRRESDDRVQTALVVTDDITHGICGACEELLQIGAEPPLCPMCNRNWKMQGADVCGDCFRDMEAYPDG
jgi:hypothetical protein